MGRNPPQDMPTPGRPRLTQARTLCGLSHESAARLTRRTGTVVRNWEDGKGPVRSDGIDHAREYCRALQAHAAEKNINIGIPAKFAEAPEGWLMPDVFTPVTA